MFMRCICGREFPYTKPGLSPNESPSFLSLKYRKGPRRLKVHKYSDLLYLIPMAEPDSLLDETYPQQSLRLLLVALETHHGRVTMAAPHNEKSPILTFLPDYYKARQESQVKFFCKERQKE